MSQASAPHAVARAARAKSAFAELRTEAEVEARAAEIAALPTVAWKGRTLYVLRCRGLSGKGPHDTNVPEGLLWSLLDFRAFRCPFHANSDIEPNDKIREKLDLAYTALIQEGLRDPGPPLAPKAEPV